MMNSYGVLLPGAVVFARIPSGKTSKKVKARLKWFDYYAKCSNTELVAKTKANFSISHQGVGK